jgi:L-iditol 2-dehydrogenase
MKVAIMDRIGKLSFASRPIPVAERDEALVKLEYVGVCGSDLHYFEYGRIGDFIVEPPFVLGHEAGGVVVEVGENVKALKPGDRVALEPGLPCGHCEFCKTGKYNLCPDVIFFATPPIDGVFQEYVAHKADFCFKLPENVSTLEGALIEPLSVGIHAAKQAEAELGQSAVVFGAGCIGLATLLALQARGVTRVFIADSMPKRLEKAFELGAADAINFTERNTVDEVLKATGGRGVDIAIDTSGSEVAVNQAIRLVRKAGTVVFVGYSASGKMNLDISAATNSELKFNTVFRYRHSYPSTIDAVASGRIDVKKIVTNTFDFDDLPRALEESISKKAEIVKSVIKMS